MKYLPKISIAERAASLLPGVVKALRETRAELIALRTENEQLRKRDAQIDAEIQQAMSQEYAEITRLREELYHLRGCHRRLLCNRLLQQSDT